MAGMALNPDAKPSSRSKTQLLPGIITLSPSGHLLHGVSPQREQDPPGQVSISALMPVPQPTISRHAPVEAPKSLKGSSLLDRMSHNFPRSFPAYPSLLTVSVSYQAVSSHGLYLNAAA